MEMVGSPAADWKGRLLIYAAFSCILFLLYLVHCSFSLQQKMR